MVCASQLPVPKTHDHLIAHDYPGQAGFMYSSRSTITIKNNSKTAEQLVSRGLAISCSRPFFPDWPQLTFSDATRQKVLL